MRSSATRRPRAGRWVAQTYLSSGAYGYLGSSTIADGPADDNGLAGLICRYFLQRILAGASLGRALLEARQEFASHESDFDPFDLKTLAQFHLFGDPSIHPVVAPDRARRENAGENGAAGRVPCGHGEARRQDPGWADHRARRTRVRGQIVSYRKIHSR